MGEEGIMKELFGKYSVTLGTDPEVFIGYDNSRGKFVPVTLR